MRRALQGIDQKGIEQMVKIYLVSVPSPPDSNPLHHRARFIHHDFEVYVRRRSL